MLMNGDELACYSAPANVLLFGEYAILERSGLGIISAIAPRITAAISPATEFSVIGLAGGKEVTINSEMLIANDMENSTSVGQSVAVSSEALFLCGLTRFLIAALYPRRHKIHNTLKALRYSITIDARPCYDTDGRKIGLGSSAASAVCLTAALAHLCGARPHSKWSALLRSGALSSADSMTNAHSRTSSSDKLVKQRIFQKGIFRLALRAHRKVRGGGSGYDIAASSFGGFALFRGGYRPRVQPCNPPWSKSEMRLLYGTQTVDSREAVARCQRWKRTHRQDWRKYVRQSNQIVNLMLSAQTEQEVIRIINISRELQLALGENIGVTAFFPLPADSATDYPRIAYRTVGAGNELAVAFGTTGAGGNSGNGSGNRHQHHSSHNDSGKVAKLPYEEPLSVENDGVRWEQ